MRSDTALAGVLGVSHSAFTISSLALGFPIGGSGNILWTGMQMLQSGTALFGVLATILLGGLGISVMNKHTENKRILNRRIRQKQREIDRQEKINHKEIEDMCDDVLSGAMHDYNNVETYNVLNGYLNGAQPYYN